MFRRELFTAVFSIFFYPANRPKSKKKGLIVHHTLFWLKDPRSEENKTKLIESLRTLIKIESHRTLIGVPIHTPTYEGTDSSYDVSIVTYFDDVDGLVIYQNNPRYQEFFSSNRGLLDRFVLYDTICEIP